MDEGGRSSQWGPTLLVGGLLAWSALPVAWLWRQAMRAGGTLSGADGPFAADQLQYLAWVRESAVHFLAGNLYTIPAGDRVFVHPMAEISGLLYRAGLDINYTWIIWKVPAAIALGITAFAYARRLLPRGIASFAAAVLGVFYLSPLVPIYAWIRPGGANAVLATAGDIFSAGTSWGYLPATISVALMTAYLLVADRLVKHGGMGLTAGAAILGLFAAWLHPWQGVVLILISGAVALWSRLSAGTRRLIIPAGVTALPVIWYLYLSRTDPSWEFGQSVNQVARPSLGHLLISLAPLAAVAVFGLRNPRDDFQERALLVWPVAAFVAYLLLPSFPTHALQGMAIPLAVLAVRGVIRLFPKGSLASAALVICVAVLTLPGMAHFGNWYRDFVNAAEQAHVLEADEVRALRFVEDRPVSGGVLTTADLGAAVPPWTGRASWIGHQSWTPDFGERATAMAALNDGKLSEKNTRTLVKESGARFVLLGCDHSRRADSVLRRISEADRRFGCASVYQVD